MHTVCLFIMELATQSRMALFSVRVVNIPVNNILEPATQS
jgi:hypothetical protein